MEGDEFEVKEKMKDVNRLHIQTNHLHLNANWRFKIAIIKKDNKQHDVLPTEHQLT